MEYSSNLQQICSHQTELRNALYFHKYIQALKINMPELDKESFTFKNLQPINYLKTFNKMRDYMIKNQPNSYRKGQLKIVNLSKFPLPAYYSEMEGIFQSANRKNTENIRNKGKVLQQKQEEEFIHKHKLFVKKTLEKIIDDNSKQQFNFIRTKQEFLRNKKIPQAETLKLVKTRSEPKLGKINFNMTNSTNSIKNKQMASSNLSLKRKIQLLQNKNQQNNDENTQRSQKIAIQQINGHNHIFKELIPPKKKQKFHKRHFEQIQDFLTTRKTFKNSQITQIKAPPTLTSFTQRNYKSQYGKQNRSKPLGQLRSSDEIYQNSENQNNQNDQDFIQELFHTTRSIPKANQDIIQKYVIDLQVEQAITQGQFGSKLDDKIRVFKKKLDGQVKNIQSLKY